MDSATHRLYASTDLDDSDAFVRELVQLAPDTSPSGKEPRALVAWGERRSFARITEDVARAAEIGLRRVEAGQMPLVGPRDTVIVEAEQALALSHRSDPVLAATTIPRGALIVAGFSGGEDPWEAARHLSRFWDHPEVVVLPQGRAWLADRLAAAPRTTRRNPTFGVVGASGGIGVSTTTLWIAARLLEDGDSPIVVDAVPGSVALESCVCPENLTGLRWEDIGRLPRRPEPTQIMATVPCPHGVPILSGDPALHDVPEAPGADIWATVDDLSHEAVPVVDLGTVPMSWSEPEKSPILQCSVLVLLVPFTLRGLCNAQSACLRWAEVVPIVPIGTGPRWCDVSDADVARAIGMPLAGVLPHVIAVHEAYESGRLLEISYKRPIRRSLGEIVDVLRKSAHDRQDPVPSHALSAADQFSTIASVSGRRFEDRPRAPKTDGPGRTGGSERVSGKKNPARHEEMR